jgi:hypothetical protein
MENKIVWEANVRDFDFWPEYKGPINLNTGKTIGDYERELQSKLLAKVDMVNHPPHYTSHPSGIECIQIVEHMGFNLGNALKYIWRADLKKDPIEDLEKAKFYIERELQKRARTDTQRT